MRHNARNWLEQASKVRHYRKDLLSAAQLAGLQRRTDELAQLLKDRADGARLKLSIEALEAVLRETGGAVYPKNALVENVEFFLVAAIIIIGFRTYFIQPFKIPTNSMWPTYHGMTAENMPPGGEAPGIVGKAFRFLAFGAVRKEVVAPADGDVSAVFLETGAMAYSVRKDRKWLVIPTQVREYTFFVSGQSATVRVPFDFHDFDRVVQETFFGGATGFAAHLSTLQRTGLLERAVVQLAPGEGTRIVKVPLQRTVKQGGLILRFDILTGDQLFVDRISYHFVRPAAGQGFVFRTQHIADIGQDQYYIKRLAGVPGDVLEIKEPVLYRNGSPISGAAAFAKNANREPPYRGYFNGPDDPRLLSRLLLKNQKTVVPADSYVALGDNSDNSQDGRYWGFVPAKDVVGRPLFIYYPFTNRWGIAR